VNIFFIAAFLTLLCVAGAPAFAQTGPAPEPAAAAASKPASSATEQAAHAREALEAQIARQVDEYNKAHKRFVGARAIEPSAALYLEQWVHRIERVGSLNYPEAARGKYYGTVQFSAEIRPDGSLSRFTLLQSSGYPILDNAAADIVRMAAPYDPVPADVLKGNDLLVITRTMNFTQGNHVTGLE
jgi:protein TonB